MVPLWGVRVCKVDGNLVFNASYSEREKSQFDIVVAGTSEKINMLEVSAKIVPEKRNG